MNHAADAMPASRIDGAPSDAAAFYGGACDPRRSVVVEACAGALAVGEVGEHDIGEAEDGGGAFKQTRGVERLHRFPEIITEIG